MSAAYLHKVKRFFQACRFAADLAGKPLDHLRVTETVVKIFQLKGTHVAGSLAGQFSASSIASSRSCSSIALRISR